jgi:folate-binding protein YgfZ
MGMKNLHIQCLTQYDRRTLSLDKRGDKQVPIVHHMNRSVFLLQGDDLSCFLQGVITNDVLQLPSKRVLYSALLTPQGRFFCDFFLFWEEGKIFLECVTEMKEHLLKKFQLYKLRSQITILDVSDAYGVYTYQESRACEEEWPLDPRCQELGYRALLRKEDAVLIFKESGITEDTSSYEELRLALGIPEPIRDMVPEKSIPLECGLDQLNAISWDKGCYVGQELTARTYYQGLIRKRFLPVKIEGALSEGSPLLIYQDGQEVGTLHSHTGSVGIARLRIDQIQEALAGSKKLQCESAQLSPYVPRWMT